MPPRRSPAATALRAALQTHPVGTHVFTVSGIERLAFTTADVARLLFGAPADAREAKRHRERVADYHRRGLLSGRKVGNHILIPGAALAAFVASLDDREDVRSKAS